MTTAQQVVQGKPRFDMAAYQRSYYARNRDKLAEHKRSYYARNRDKIAELQRSYRARNRVVKNKTRRACMCCKKSFLSTGPHHRLCSPCRRGPH